MSQKKDKGIKEDFTQFLLDEELSKTLDPNQVQKVDESTQKTGIAKIITPIAEPTQQIATQKTSEKPESHSTLVNVDAALKQSEFLKVAQKKITELESKTQKLLSENEQLSVGALQVQKKYDEFYQKSIDLEKTVQDLKQTHLEEKQFLENSLKHQRKEKENLELKIEQLSIRLNEQHGSTRLREKELENRLELLQLDDKTIQNKKDEMILDLKRKIDKISQEIENHRENSKNLNNQILNHKDQIRRTVKALRLALTMLETESLAELKKTGSDS